MSSTNRGGKRNDHDYYCTPVRFIRAFLQEWLTDDPEANACFKSGAVLDPCAGGNAQAVRWKNGEQMVMVPPTPMSYPAAIEGLGFKPYLFTNDIRADSPAGNHYDFLTWELPFAPDVVITNPPFFLAMEVIERALSVVKPGGYVVMLLRLNFYGSAKRFPFMRANAPQRAYVHHERMGFTPGGKTDSIEYQHAVWRRGYATLSTVLRVI